MNTPLSRRKFVKNSAILGAGAATLSNVKSMRGADAPSNKLLVAVIGLSRGRGHISAWTQVPGVEIAYVCDVDSKRLAVGAKAVADRQSAKPKTVTDFRRILEDPKVDIISIAMPNYWHTTAAIMALKAGKHVYVEKPGSASAQEGELLVAATRKYDRYVQMGNQRRSYPSMIEAMAKLQDGVIGKLLYSRCHYNGLRPSIGKGKPGTPPENINYELWQGPVPDYPYKSNLLHYNWHWHWHFGGGELLNNGVHALDLSRWGLGLTNPSRVAYVGGRYHHDDDQETPDTGSAQYHFGDMGASWEGSSCHPRKPDALPFVSFYGTEGSMECDGAGGSVIYDMNGKETAKIEATRGDVPHFTNLADCIRYGGALNSEIAEGQLSALWCHLGNIAYRTNSTLEINPDNGKIIGNEAAQKLWSRQYRPGWELKI